MKKILILNITALYFFCAGTGKKLENFNAGNPPENEQTYSQYTDFLFLASRQYENNQCNESIQNADKALALYPDGASAWQLKGLCFLQMKQFPEATTAFERADKSEPDNEKTLLGLALSAQTTDSAKNLTTLGKLVALRPQNPDYLYAQGTSYRRVKENKKAILSFEKALEKKYTPVEAIYQQLGEIYAESGDNNKALAYFEKAGTGGTANEEIKGKSAELRYKKFMSDAKIKAQAKEYAQAAEFFIKAANEKATEEAYLSAGLMKYQASLFQEAGTYLNKCISLNDKNEEAWAYLIASQQKSQDETASKTAEKALDLFPESYMVLYSAGNFYEETGNSMRALEIYRKASGLKSAQSAVFARIITLAFDTGQRRRAELSLNEAFIRFSSQENTKKELKELYDILQFGHDAGKAVAGSNVKELTGILSKNAKFSAYPIHKKYSAQLCTMKYEKESEHKNALFTECDTKFSVLYKAEPDNANIYSLYEKFLLQAQKKEGSNKAIVKGKLSALRNKPPGVSSNQAETAIIAEGLRMENEGNILKAAIHYEKNLKKYATSTLIKRRLYYAYLKMAVLRENAGEKDADSYLKKAGKLYPKDKALQETSAVITENRVLKKYIDQAIQAEKAERTGDFTKAHAIWIKIHAKAANPRTAYRAWKSLHKSGKDASALLLKYDKQFEGKGRWQYYRARAALDSGAQKEASTLMEGAIEKNREDFEAWFQSGIIYLGSGQPDKAQNSFLQSLDINSQYSPSWVGLGVSYFYLRNTKSGRMAFNRALELSKKETLAAVNLVISEINESRYADADMALKRLEGISSASGDMHYYRGFILYLKKQYTEAVKELEQAVEIEPREEFLFGLYNAQVKAGDRIKAGQTLTMLVTKFPDGNFTRLLAVNAPNSGSTKEGLVTTGNLQIPGLGYLKKGTPFAIQNNILYYFSNLSIRAYNVSEKRNIWSVRLSAKPNYMSVGGYVLLNMGSEARLLDPNNGSLLANVPIAPSADSQMFVTGRQTATFVAHNNNGMLNVWDTKGIILYQAEKVSAIAAQRSLAFIKDGKLYYMPYCESTDCQPVISAGKYSAKSSLQFSAEGDSLLVASGGEIDFYKVSGDGKNLQFIKKVQSKEIWQSGFFKCGYYIADARRITLTDYCEDKVRVASIPTGMKTQTASLIADSKDSFRILSGDNSYSYHNGKYEKEKFIPSHKKDASLLIMRNLAR